MLFDIPNDEELNPTIKHDYDLIQKDYPQGINNNPTSVYDQFIGLRDTLIDSDKKYPWKRGATLIIWNRERSIEIKYKNRCKVSFDGDTANPTNLYADLEWPYIEMDTTYGQLGIIIKEDGRYRITHKMQIFPNPNTERVLAYCDYYPINDDGTYPLGWQLIAVYDIKGKFSKTFTGSISGTCHGEWGGSVSGSCSVNVNFKLWDIIQTITAFWYNERDMRRWDKMCFKAVDENDQPLALQGNSNFFSVEYLDFNKDKHGNN